MKQVNSDLRVEKTRDKLINSYLQLVMANLSSKVLDICNNAKVSPITFYHHFDDKQDFVKYVVNTQLKYFLPIPNKLKPTNLKQLTIYLLRSLFNFYNQNKSILINKDKTYLDILDKTISFYLNQEVSILLEDKNQYVIQTITNFILGGIFKILQSKIQNSDPINSTFVWNCIKKYCSSVNTNYFN